MSVGGTIIDIVKLHDHKWWINTVDTHAMLSEKTGTAVGSVAVYVDPDGEILEVGDGFWWQDNTCYWTSRKQYARRKNVPLKKLSYSGVGHPDRVKKQHGT